MFLFQKTQSLDKAASKYFVKKMLAIGVSNIIYLRNIFPEDAFADRKIEGTSKSLAHYCDIFVSLYSASKAD